MKFLHPALLLAFALPAHSEITSRNIRFVDYPNFPDAHSTWGSIGYSSHYDKVFIGVTNHRDRVGLFEYDVSRRAMSLCGFVPDLTNLRTYQWQGKVHSKLVEGPDGSMYFTTDGGESREEYLMEHPHGYNGSFFFRWDPSARTLRNLGSGPRFESIKDLEVDQSDGSILAVSYPQVHLLHYNPARNDLRDLGRVGSDHVPRVIFKDWWNNIYYVDWRQRLIKYEHSTGRLLFARDSLPMFPETNGGQIVTGITAYATDRAHGIIYLVTYSSKMLAFHPAESGIGPVDDLGGVFDAPGKPPNSYYCPNLALAKNGKLYYFLGGHGMFAVGSENVMMEFDPATKTKKIVLHFPRNVIEEVTGSDVTDKHGTLYFAGRKSDRRAARMGESGASRPFLIIFNPNKEVQK